MVFSMSVERRFKSRTWSGGSRVGWPSGLRRGRREEVSCAVKSCLDPACEDVGLSAADLWASVKPSVTLLVKSSIQNYYIQYYDNLIKMATCVGKKKSVWCVLDERKLSSDEVSYLQ